MSNDFIFFEIDSFNEFIFGINASLGWFLNYINIMDKHVYFRIFQIKGTNKKICYYCILNKKLPYKWINFNPRTFEIKLVNKPLHNANNNIAIINCKNINFINEFMKFINL